MLHFNSIHCSARGRSYTATHTEKNNQNYPAPFLFFFLFFLSTQLVSLWTSCVHSHRWSRVATRAREQQQQQQHTHTHTYTNTTRNASDQILTEIQKEKKRKSAPCLPDDPGCCPPSSPSPHTAERRNGSSVPNIKSRFPSVRVALCEPASAVHPQVSTGNSGMEVDSLGVRLWSPPFLLLLPPPPPSGRVVPELCVVADGGLVRSPLSESPPLQPAEALSAAQHPVSLVLPRKRERESERERERERTRENERRKRKKGGPSVSFKEWHRIFFLPLRKAVLLRICSVSVCLQLLPLVQNGC